MAKTLLLLVLYTFLSLSPTPNLIPEPPPNFHPIISTTTTTFINLELYGNDNRDENGVRKLYFQAFLQDFPLELLVYAGQKNGEKN
jgi:hypothetical protein